MPGTLYVCEASGARVIAYGSGITQLGTEYQMELETHDELPMGEAGDCYFRGIDATIEYTNGFNIGITPIVDGVELTERTFTGAGSGIQPLQADVGVRGSRMSARVRTITRTGDIVPHNVQAQVVPIREVP